MDNGIINVEQMINKRADRMRSVMRDQGMGVLLTFNPETITYLTGVEVPDRFRDTESFFVVFPQSGELSLYALTTDFIASKYPWVRGYINQSVSINSIFADNHSLEFIIDRIVETIYSNGLEGLDAGIEGSTNALAFAESLRPLGLHLVNARGCVNHARMIKFSEEVQCISISAEDAAKAYEVIKEELVPGISESDLVERSRSRMFKSGIMLPKEIIITSGTNTNPPSVNPRDKIIEYGDIVNISIHGRRINGYSAFFYRSAAAGKASDEKKDAYRTVREMLRLGAGRIRDGRAFEDVWNAIEIQSRKWGFGDFSSRAEMCTVHGLGLSLFEYPAYSDLTISSSEKFESGMVIDSYVWGGYKGGSYGVRMSENLLVTDTGSLSISGEPEDELQECGI